MLQLLQIVLETYLWGMEIKCERKRKKKKIEKRKHVNEGKKLIEEQKQKLTQNNNTTYKKLGISKNSSFIHYLFC